MKKEEFVRKIYDAAVKIGEIDPIFVTAQAALESGWGASAIGTYNIFGITKGSCKGECKLVLTTEYFSLPDKRFGDGERVVSVEKVGTKRYRYSVYRWFRVYASYEECLRDHLAILQKPMYADAWEHRKDRHEFLRRIAGRYATAPNYVEIMESMFKSVERRL